MNESFWIVFSKQETFNCGQIIIFVCGENEYMSNYILRAYTLFLSTN